MKLIKTIKSQINVNFEFIDINTPCNNAFGFLDFSSEKNIE
jgi:hypothetical protein